MSSTRQTTREEVDRQPSGRAQAITYSGQSLKEPVSWSWNTAGCVEHGGVWFTWHPEPTTCTRQELVERVFHWVSTHPGCDAEHVADAIGIPDVVADDIIEKLLGQGLLDFDE